MTDETDRLRIAMASKREADLRQETRAQAEAARIATEIARIPEIRANLNNALSAVNQVLAENGHELIVSEGTPTKITPYQVTIFFKGSGSSATCVAVLDDYGWLTARFHRGTSDGGLSAYNIQPGSVDWFRHCLVELVEAAFKP